MTLPIVFLPVGVFEETWSALRSFCRGGDQEGVAYWFGIADEESAVVTTVIVPNAEAGWGMVRTSASANAEVVEAIMGTPLVLLGQAHSHPGKNVRHSPADDGQTFASFQGAISVVVPYYAKGMPSLDGCGIHRVIDRSFVYLDQEAWGDHLRLIPSYHDFRRAH
jgi:hypothetical protein